MSETVLYTSLIVMAYLAGIGTLATVLLFRQPHPGTRAKEPAEPAERPAPGPAAQPAAPRTVHHEYDTMDVLEAGWAARDTGHHLVPLRACGAAPGGLGAPPDWRCAKPAGHLYLHETATGGTWGDNTFEQAPVGPWQPHPAEEYSEGAPR